MNNFKKVLMLSMLMGLLLSSCGSNKKGSSSSESKSSSGSVSESSSSSSSSSEESSSEESSSSEVSSSEESSSEESSSSEKSSSEESSSEESSSSSEEELTFTVIWKDYDGTPLEIDEDVPYGDVPSYDGEDPERADDEQFTYTFDGWTPELTPVTSDRVYTAVYDREKIKYTINFDLNGGESESYHGSVQVENFTKDVFFFDCVRSEYNFRGWEYNGEKIFDEKGNQLANPVMAKSMTFIALFSQTARLEIVTNISGAGSVTGAGEYLYNTQVNVDAEANEGYQFVGWYVEEECLSNFHAYRYMMWDKDIVLEARFAPKSYLLTIETNDDTVGLVTLKNYSGPYADHIDEWKLYTSSVTIIAYSIDETRFMGWYDTDGELVTTNSVYTFTMPNYNYHLIAKWKNYISISYVLNGEDVINPNPLELSVSASPVELMNPVPSSPRAFLNWRYRNKRIESIDPAENRDMVIEAIWLDLCSSIPTIRGESSVFFGLYPKWLVNSSLYEDLEEEAVLQDNGWYLYNGELYAKTVAAERPEGNTDVKFSNGTTPVVVGQTYWFKVGYLSWSILSKEDGEYYLLCSLLVDAHCYYHALTTRNIGGKTIYANNYEHSDIRAWLNDEFYNTAFDSENPYVQISTVNNGVETSKSGSASFVCNDTEDKVFLASYQDYHNVDYGFADNDSVNSKRSLNPTDWAIARGAYYALSTDRSWYWTRSPSASAQGASEVDVDGSIADVYVNYNDACVRPAIKIRFN